MAVTVKMFWGPRCCCCHRCSCFYYFASISPGSRPCSLSPWPSATRRAPPSPPWRTARLSSRRRTAGTTLTMWTWRILTEESEGSPQTAAENQETIVNNIIQWMRKNQRIFSCLYLHITLVIIKCNNILNQVTLLLLRCYLIQYSWDSAVAMEIFN